MGAACCALFLRSLRSSELHHYLELPHMIAGTNYLGVGDGNPVAHVAVSPQFECSEAMSA